jgi:hypothetical protein
MRIEGRRDQARLSPSRLLHASTQHRPVPEMHAVEVPENDDYSAHKTASGRASSPESRYIASRSSPLITR